MALGNFVITGVVATFSYLTYQIVSKPKTWGEQKHPYARLLPMSLAPRLLPLQYPAMGSYGPRTYRPVPSHRDRNLHCLRREI
jgi:hypothetical protein